MNVFAEQLAAHENEVEVLRKIRRETLANSIPKLFADTNVNCFALAVVVIDGAERLHIAVGHEHINEGEAVPPYRPDNCFHDKGGCNFDLAEHGNEQVRQFLELGIEWDDMIAIVRQVAAHFYDIVELFHLIPDSNQVVFSGGKYWVTANETFAIPEQEAA